MALNNKIKITTNLRLLSGLHIGGNRESSDIGGIDNPVIRRRDNQQPYIPGSSLKGKIRSLLEQIEGISEVGGGRKDVKVKSDQCNWINTVFGFANDNKPSRIIVRDAYLTSESAEELKNSEYTDMPYTEAKIENTIDRVKGKADHPRTQERVPAGVDFKLEFVINDHSDHDVKKIRELLIKGLNAINNDYLGGSGSRGYGHIKIDLPEIAGSRWEEEVIKLSK